MFKHQEADRVPIIDSPWSGTIRRWRREGMPADMDWRRYFDTDITVGLGVDNSPRYPTKVIEETEDYSISTTGWGVTLKYLKGEDTTPEFLDYKVNTPEAWEECKSRMKPTRDRVNWDYLKKAYPGWEKNGYWSEAGFWFGFDVTHSWMAGTTTVLMAMLEDPEWASDMFNTYLDMDIALYDMIWDEGYRFDCIAWPDDMGYKNTTFFSPQLYRDILKPVHKRAVDWAHNKGIYVRLHSCGDVMTFVPDLIDIGIDALNPLEIKAGMDPKKLKPDYGDKLVLHGGINAVLWDDKDAIISEIERTVPILKENGGYIFSSDHSIPNSVTLENMQAIVDTVKRVGAYS
jgi:uroporphyrinogen decarboxylase